MHGGRRPFYLGPRLQLVIITLLADYFPALDMRILAILVIAFCDDF